MSQGWIAVSEPEVGRVALHGPVPGRGHAEGLLSAQCDAADLLTRGTLMIEADLSQTDRPVTLFEMTHQLPWPGHLSLQQIPGGALALVQSQGRTVRHIGMQIPFADRARRLRLTYAWDAPKREARLFVERIGQDDPPMVERLADPLPLPRAALCEAVTLPGSVTVGETVDFIAVSDRIEPVGPMPTLPAEAHVATPEGARPVCDLHPGDLVSVPGVGAVPVLANLSRSLPARGTFRPVSLRAPYFGLSRDITVAGGQGLVVRGSDVEYLFASEAVLVAARYLVSERIGQFVDAGPLVRYHQLLLPQHHAILVHDCAMESLLVGRMRRNADVLEHSLLRDYPRACLPHHAQTVYPVLMGHDAVTLTSYRAA